MEKPSTYKEQVTNILTRSQKSRNSNLRLDRLILQEFYNTDMRAITAYELFVGIANKTLPNIDVIGRVSRRVQETTPELRGTEWKKRQRLQKPVVKDLQNNF